MNTTQIFAFLYLVGTCAGSVVGKFYPWWSGAGYAYLGTFGALGFFLLAARNPHAVTSGGRAVALGLWWGAAAGVLATGCDEFAAWLLRVPHSNGVASAAAALGVAAGFAALVLPHPAADQDRPRLSLLGLVLAICTLALTILPLIGAWR